jgi:hypothetical protein
MEAIRDIFINLLSDAIWALGGFLVAQFLFLKNFRVVSFPGPTVKKKSIIVQFIGLVHFKKLFLSVCKCNNLSLSYWMILLHRIP